MQKPQNVPKPQPTPQILQVHGLRTQTHKRNFGSHCITNLTDNNNNSLKKSVLNTVLNTVRIVKSFSVPTEECNTLVKFQELADRDFKGNFSQALIFAMKETLERHTPANPQVTIDRCLRLKMPVKSNRLCCIPGCQAKTKYQIVLKNFAGKEEQFNTCERHRRWKHSEFKFMVRWKQIA